MAELETTAAAAPVLAALDRLLAADLKDAVVRASDAARRMLARTREPFGWAPIDLSGAQLPPGIASAWVFVIAGRARPEPHRHPNSVQHLRSLEGAGRVALWRHDAPERGEWVLDERQPWLVIARDVVHAPRSLSSADWVVASFHTVPAEELLEVAESGERRYV